jgi:bifunctional UDP-N-acetylglucosamine pyrophosphorylase/glucosamine-1-phosphate N-acetyltransferase
LALHIVILAAGQGKRMQSKRAKVLLPLAGRPMLDYVLAAARALKPECIHIVHGHLGEQLCARYGGDADVTMVAQPEQRGTGHAVMQAMPGIADGHEVLVLLGDVPLIRSETLSALLALESSLKLLSVELSDASGYGRVELDREGKGEVLRIIEHKDANAAQRAIRRINSGVIACESGLLRRLLAELRPDNVQGEYYLTDIFALAARDGKPGRTLDGDAEEVQGANDAAQLASLQACFERRAVAALLHAGVRMARPEQVYVRGEVAAQADVELDVQVILEGQVSLGESVRIGPFCRLRDCALAAGTEVLAHSDLDGVRTTGACRIGPFARLRPGTVLAEGVHVGNFVETKQAHLGRHSKANHLSYLGDVDIGQQVNIGAGTITCNYDGVNKHLTRIDDEVFVGSNSALIAPVRLERGATIGAGSVISRDAPADALTLARAPQTTVNKWQRPKKQKP